MPTAQHRWSLLCNTAYEDIAGRNWQLFAHVIIGLAS